MCYMSINGTSLQRMSKKASFSVHILHVGKSMECGNMEGGGWSSKVEQPSPRKVKSECPARRRLLASLGEAV